MSENTTPAAVGSSEELGLELEDALQRYWDAAYAEGMDGRDHDTEDGRAGTALRDVLLAVNAMVAAERERWQQAAKAVIESHDAALAYVYERLRSQGVRGITIHDTAAAEIRAVNALRELVQPNTQINAAEGVR